ncbi:MAG: AraC family transcriptional regulator, partial [Turicibacter sp.]|nr:AraC family transcriptional regulator [Turicibacter sp.]
KFNHAKYTVSHIFIQSQKNILEYQKIHRIFKRVFKNEYEVLYQFNNQMIVINSWKVTCNEEDVLSYYDELKNQLLNELENDFFISLGTIVEDIEHLKNSYSTVKKLKKFMLTHGSNIVMTEKMISRVESRKINFKDEINQINKLIIEKNLEALKKYVETIYEQETLTPTNIYDLSIKIVLLIDSMREEFQVNKDYYESLSDIIIKLCNESTRESVRTFILSELEAFIKMMHQDVVKYSPVVQQVVNLVNERYYEELSLKTLAYQYNINSSYLGQLFNKEVGTSFSDYLNKTKNLKAKQLILETNMKINDIAKEVGYTDSSYFYRKFKKFFGVSPSSLRELKVYGSSSVDEKVI